MGVSAKRPKRGLRANDIDRGSIDAQKYNDAAGGIKMIAIEPVVIRAIIADENVGAGKLVKVTGTSYTLKMIGKAYSAALIYQRGDLSVNGGFIYMAMQDQITGAFDASKWKKVATETVGPVTISAGAVVSTGRWHNSVGTAGFLVDDDSEISHQRVRD